MPARLRPRATRKLPSPGRRACGRAMPGAIQELTVRSRSSTADSTFSFFSSGAVRHTASTISRSAPALERLRRKTMRWGLRCSARFMSRACRLESGPQPRCSSARALSRAQRRNFS